jgi:hypothetical protein
MNTKMIKCKQCNYLVMAYKVKFNKRINSDVTFLDPSDGYKPTMCCPKCNGFLHQTVGLKFENLNIRII